MSLPSGCARCGQAPAGIAKLLGAARVCPMSALKRLLVLIAALASLGGCAGLDAGQARLCRAVIPALNGTALAIEVVRTAPLPAAQGVRVDYRVQSAAGQRDRFL